MATSVVSRRWSLEPRATRTFVRRPGGRASGQAARFALLFALIVLVVGLGLESESELELELFAAVGVALDALAA